MQGEASAEETLLVFLEMFLMNIATFRLLYYMSAVIRAIEISKTAWSSILLEQERILRLGLQVPLEYLTKEAVGNRLPNIKLSKMAEDMLFYVFYNFPGEVYQVAVAHEL